MAQNWVTDENGKARGSFGLGDGEAQLRIYGDDGKTPVAYLGENPTYNEMNFVIRSKSKTDKRQVMMMIGKNGGRFDSLLSLLFKSISNLS